MTRMTYFSAWWGRHGGISRMRWEPCHKRLQGIMIFVLIWRCSKKHISSRVRSPFMKYALSNKHNFHSIHKWYDDVKHYLCFGFHWAVELIHKVSKKIRRMSIYLSNKFFNQGLVLDGRPNLKLFNQLYWLITLAFVVVGHVVYPLPQLISGTFPAQSRYR